MRVLCNTGLLVGLHMSFSHLSCFSSMLALKKTFLFHAFEIKNVKGLVLQVDLHINVKKMLKP